MKYLAIAVFFSLTFNLAIWVSCGTGGLLVGGLANALGGLAIIAIFIK